MRGAALRRYDGYLDEKTVHCSSPATWRRLVLESAEVAALRADSRRTLTAVVWRLTCSADWTVHTSRLGWDATAAELDISRRTLARWLAWLRKQHWLTWVEHGSTPAYRPRLVQKVLEASARHTGAHAGDRQPVYLLVVPNPDPHPCSPAVETAGCSNASSSARELRSVPQPLGPEPVLASPTRPNGCGLSTGEDGTPTPKGLSRSLPLTRARDFATPRELSDLTLRTAPQTRRGRLKAVEMLREPAAPGHALRRLTPRHLRHLLKAFFDAGWTARDVQFALDHDPSGRAHFHATQVRSPAGWVRHRLSLWCIEGFPGPSMTQRAEQRAAAAREHVAAYRALEEQARARAVRSEASSEYQSARAELRKLRRRR